MVNEIGDDTIHCVDEIRFTVPLLSLVVLAVELAVTGVLDTVMEGMLVDAVEAAVVAPGTSPWMVSSRMLQALRQTTWQLIS